MTELATLPASIRERIEEARSLASQHREVDSQALIRQATAELARTQPDVAALMIAGALGYEGYDIVSVEQITGYERVEHHVFGIKVSEEWIPMTTTKVHTRQYRLVRPAGQW